MILPVVSAQLLNAIPDPVLVIDRTQNAAIIGNSQFIKLTAFTQSEILGMPISKLVEGIDPLELFEEHLVSLARHSRTSVRMSMSITLVDNAGQYWLLSFKQPEIIQEQLMHTEVIQLLVKVMALLEEEDFSTAMQEAALLTTRICGAGFAGIYFADSADPCLKRLAAYPEETHLPLELPPTDLARLDGPAVWIPGRRLQTELYKMARVNGLAYLASVPIGSSSNIEKNPGGLVGLLVVSDLEQQPSNNLLEILNLIGAQLSAYYNQRIKNEELTENLRDQADTLILRNWQMDHQREGVLVVSPDLTVVEINPAAEWMLEYTPAEVQGQPVINILIGTKSLLPALQEACAGIPTHNLSEIALHRRSGQSFPAQVRIIPVQSLSTEQADSQKQVIGILVFISDVSERQQIQERTQQLEHRALLGEVIAVFAHEVRNPINNIATGLQLMETWLAPGLEGRGEQKGDSRQIQLVQRMLGDCQRLNHLMESVLQFSRPIEPRLEPLDMLSFLQRFLDRWRPRLARVNITPYLNPEQAVPKVMGDPRALEQVFTNLISNAVHAMSSSGGTLAMRLSLNQTITNYPQVEITVSDTGPGIPEEFRVRLFEPFVTSSPSGTGLGLAITKRIITAHRGSIWVESFPGGTVFHILLPAAPPESGE
jgi:two-component system sensor histidine kinase AtoS